MDIIKIINSCESVDCVGKIYRCKINRFLNSKKEYVEQVRMIPQKRLSCRGCQHCGYLEEQISDFIQNKESLLPEEPVNGALYHIEIINEVQDWETGIVDEWDLAFIKMETEE